MLRWQQSVLSSRYQNLPLAAWTVLVVQRGLAAVLAADVVGYLAVRISVFLNSATARASPVIAEEQTP